MKTRLQNVPFKCNVRRYSESLQDSDLVRRLGEIIAKRMIKFMTERAKAEPEKYAEVRPYGLGFMV